ncbi:MAG: mevalonate kinase [Patescibacteria group bacterium]
MTERVEASAPGKLMLFGEHAVVYGRPCIVTAVDHRMTVSAELIGGKIIEIQAPDVGIGEHREEVEHLERENAPKGVRFVSVAIRNFFKNFNLSSGLRIQTKSDFSSEFGFGSSSAVTVGTLKALSEIFEKRLDNKKLFDLSYKTILDVQGVGSGFDIAAAIWGGTVYFVAGGKKVEPLRTGKLPLVVGYTGVKADTPTLVRQVGEFYKGSREVVDRIFDSIENIVEAGRKALENKEYKRLGELMDANQNLLEQLKVGSPELARLISAAKAGGAFGAKLSGAGGGDCMIAFVPEMLRKNVEDEIEKSGGKVIEVRTNAEGVKIER